MVEALRDGGELVGRDRLLLGGAVGMVGDLACQVFGDDSAALGDERGARRLGGRVGFRHHFVEAQVPRRPGAGIAGEADDGEIELHAVEIETITLAFGGDAQGGGPEVALLGAGEQGGADVAAFRGERGFERGGDDRLRLGEEAADFGGGLRFAAQGAFVDDGGGFGIEFDDEVDPAVVFEVEEAGPGDERGDAGGVLAGRGLVSGWVSK